VTTRIRRTYLDGCAIAHALNMVGERWALLIVRELLLGPKRFADLQAGIPGAGPTILVHRLRELEEVGVLRRRTLPRPAASKVYELTDWGAELEVVVTALGRWGAQSPILAPSGDVGPDSYMLSLRAFFQPRPGARWTASYEIWLDDNAFVVRIVDGELAEVARRESDTRPDARIETDPTTFGDLLSGRQQLPTARAGGRLTLTGDVRAVRRLLSAVRVAAPRTRRRAGERVHAI
jgi:DNA-binding HxlR family transcriptional regulator